MDGSCVDLQLVIGSYTGYHGFHPPVFKINDR